MQESEYSTLTAETEQISIMLNGLVKSLT
ncbi:MAG: hypothetical protein QXK37_06655 [Candidatus Woesearchaeota archaeon]